MSRQAVVNGEGLVVNVIELEPDADWLPPEGSVVVRSDVASPGDTLVGREFVRPTPPPRDVSFAERWSAAIDADERLHVLVDLLGVRAVLGAERYQEESDAFANIR